MSNTTEKADRKAAAQPDPVLSTLRTSSSLLDEHKGVVIGLAVLLIAAGIIYSLVDFMGKRSEKKAAVALYPVESAYLKARDGYESAKRTPPPGQNKDAAQTPPAKAASGELDKDYGTIVGDLQKIVQDYPKSSGGAQAAIYLGELFLDYKQPDQAVVTLDKVMPHLKSSEMLYGLTHLLRGTALATKGDCAQAVTVWRLVLDSKESAFIHPDALLKSGVCYESLNQTETAAQMYRRVTQEFGESAAAQSAKTLLRAINAKSASAAQSGSAG